MTAELKDKKPPRNALRARRWADLSPHIEPARYLVTEPGQKPREITVSKQTRQVLDTLLERPVYSASFCRISDKVLPLRRDHGVDIETVFYRNDPETGRERYGVYFLRGNIIRAAEPSPTEGGDT